MTLEFLVFHFFKNPNQRFLILLDTENLRNLVCITHSCI